MIVSSRRLSLACHSRSRTPSDPVGPGVLLLLPLLSVVLPLAPPLPGTLLLGRHLLYPVPLYLKVKNWEEKKENLGEEEEEALALVSCSWRAL